LGRVPFQMTDEQARKLLLLVPPLTNQFPPGRPSNRPFVHGFIRAVHTATGRTFSPAIYRRLLNTYAPDYKPSTNTLALEKEAVEREIAGTVLPAPHDAVVESRWPAPSYDVGDQVRSAVEDALIRHLGSIGKTLHGEQQMAQTHIADLSNRLAESDRALAETRGLAAKLAADLQVATERAADANARLHQAEASAQALREAQATAMQAIADELTEIRKFAMRSIDDVRGETRVERDRRGQLEELLKTNERLMEVFRQAAYRLGGAIPLELRSEQKR
jgi:hypothetical protein